MGRVPPGRSGLLHCHLYLFHFVTDTAHPATVRLRDLRLATAHALVAQSLGSEQPLQEQSPLDYLQDVLFCVHLMKRKSLSKLLI